MTIDQLLAREALRAVRIQQNGSPVTVTMVEALIKSIYAKAAKGDKTALTLIMAHLPRILEAENAKAETESRKEAEAILFGLAQRFKEAARKRSAANFDDAEIERRRLRLEEDERRAREKGDYSLDVGSILNEPMDED